MIKVGDNVMFEGKAYQVTNYKFGLFTLESGIDTKLAYENELEKIEI